MGRATGASSPPEPALPTTPDTLTRLTPRTVVLLPAEHHQEGALPLTPELLPLVQHLPAGQAFTAGLPHAEGQAAALLRRLHQPDLLCKHRLAHVADRGGSPAASQKHHERYEPWAGPRASILRAGNPPGFEVRISGWA